MIRKSRIFTWDSNSSNDFKWFLEPSTWFRIVATLPSHCSVWFVFPWVLCLGNPLTVVFIHVSICTDCNSVLVQFIIDVIQSILHCRRLPPPLILTTDYYMINYLSVSTVDTGLIAQKSIFKIKMLLPANFPVLVNYWPQPNIYNSQSSILHIYSSLWF